MLVIQDTKHGGIQLFSNIEELLNNEGFAEEFENALSKFIEAKEYHKGLNEPEEGDPRFGEKYDELMKKFDEIREQAKKEFIEPDKFRDNWNSYTEDWTSPSGITPIWETFDYDHSQRNVDDALKFFSENLKIHVNANNNGILRFSRNNNGEFEFNQFFVGDEGTPWAVEFDNTYVIADIHEAADEIPLEALFELGLLNLVDGIKNYHGNEEFSFEDFIGEAQNVIEGAKERADKELERQMKEKQITTVIEWCEENGYDHVIERNRDVVDKNEYYFARPDDDIPPFKENDAVWDKLSLSKWAKIMLEAEDWGDEILNYISENETYEEMYAREIAEVGAVKFMGIDNDSIPVELSSRIFHRFESDEQGNPQFVDDKEEPSFIMATAEIDGELFAVFVSETGIDEKGSTLLTEDDHEDYQQINFKLKNLAQDRLVEALNGCVPTKAKEYGESRSLDKEYIDTLAKNTVIRRSLDNQDRIYVYIKIPEPTLERQNKPEQEQTEEKKPEQSIAEEKTQKREESQLHSHGRDISNSLRR